MCLANYKAQKESSYKLKLKQKFDRYFKCIKEGLTCKCASCSRLWFKSSVTHYKLHKLAEKGVTADFLNAVCVKTKSNTDIGNRCSNCK